MAVAVFMCNSQCLCLGYPRAPRLHYGATEGSLKSSNEADKQVPSWVHPGSDEPLPWAHKGGNGGQQKPVAIQLPFYAYLLTSAITFIVVVRLSTPSTPLYLSDPQIL
uniref:Uncharacterized protein n=1 Tax=Oryza barthii TaxID=65489 RepID=A0A0D3G5L5_9ORYZ